MDGPINSATQNGSTVSNGHSHTNGHDTNRHHSATSLNGISTDSKPVGSYPPSGIDVLVVGTGLAGLTASIECVRKGHNVKVLERNVTINTAGKYDLFSQTLAFILN
jgi:alkyl hydroperoxide reductase subunit AhpF